MNHFVKDAFKEGGIRFYTPWGSKAKEWIGYHLV